MPQIQPDSIPTQTSPLITDTIPEDGQPSNKDLEHFTSDVAPLNESATRCLTEVASREVARIRTEAGHPIQSESV
jgi:hypothetical protein